MRAKEEGSVRSFAWYDAGRFGRGCVLCLDEAVERVWLPLNSRNGQAELSRLADEYLDTLGAGRRDGGFAGKVAERLERMFSTGEDVSDIAIVPPKGGPFVEKVWRECRRIPRGGVATYRELAAKAGNVKAARASGSAMASNPLPLLVPCHRVLSADHRLWNYGGGIAMKQHLLDLEGAAYIK
ncbi:MGMT family protein [Candidatus Sumerlaeota bacterium]|nr:MGMT family protein [Candidatus Sumerlaeota bacterium]